MRAIDDHGRWAYEQFGFAKLGDPRRTHRLVSMTKRTCRHPAGKISEVFDSDADRQGAYDFLESKHIDQNAMARAMGEACARQCASLPFAFVAVDGTTLTLVDRQKQKGFGSVGGMECNARGLKAITAMAMTPSGVATGIAAQQVWARPVRPHVSRREQKRASRRRKHDEKETKQWTDTIEQAALRFRNANAHAWFVLDREADARLILQTLVSTGHYFTVRSSWDRTLESVAGAPAKLRAALHAQPMLGVYALDVTATQKRNARRARMQVRTLDLTLRMRIDDTRHKESMPMTVVWVREWETTPEGEKPLDWMLLTNYRVQSFDEACLVVFGYTQRWRIEEMHKAWKSGSCDVEQTQLRSVAAVVRWATILLAVATRAERLKHLSRDQPDLPATAQLTALEVRALILLKRRSKKRTEHVPDSVPTLAQATRWIADIGGYTGKSSGGPPGIITIARGLIKVRAAADVLEQLDSHAN